MMRGKVNFEWSSVFWSKFGVLSLNFIKHCSCPRPPAPCSLGLLGLEFSIPGQSATMEDDLEAIDRRIASIVEARGSTYVLSLDLVSRSMSAARGRAAAGPTVLVRMSRMAAESPARRILRASVST